MRKPALAKSTCCKAKWLYEVIGGTRVYREVRGKRRYRVKCSACQRVGEVSA
jgi:hypothetical protein